MKKSTRSVIPETAARLRKLDHRDWWRLAVAIVIIVVLTGAIGGITLPLLLHGLLHDSELNIKVQGLWGVVLLFAVFAIYQQYTIIRLRRGLAAEIGMRATMELLQRPGTDAEQGWKVARRHTRYFFDHRVIVTQSAGQPASASGHTTDLSEGGIGLVLPEPFAPSARVRIELQLAAGAELLVIPAVVRHRRGYYHGLEFEELTPTTRERLRQLSAGLAPVLGRSPADPQVPAEAPVHTFKAQAS
jgi:hypothetical protein